jgi:hypothetical protein
VQIFLHRHDSYIIKRGNNRKMEKVMQWGISEFVQYSSNARNEQELSIFLCVIDREAVLYLFQLDENEDDDAIKRQCKGEGQIILDHGSDIPQVDSTDV